MLVGASIFLTLLAKYLTLCAGCCKICYKDRLCLAGLNLCVKQGLEGLMKSFKYDSRHLKLMYKYRTMRILFMTLFCFVILFQSVAWLMVWMGDEPISTMDMIFVGATLLLSLTEFICHAWLYYYNNRLIASVEQTGLAEGFVSVISANESALSRILLGFCRLLVIVFAVFVGICVFSFVDNIINWGEILLKIPALVMLLVAFLNLSGIIRYNQLLVVEK